MLTTIERLKSVPAEESVRLFKEYVADVTPVEGAGRGRYRFTITTNDPDRDRDVIAADGWRLDGYLKNPVVLWAHDYRQPPVAVSRLLERTERGLVSEAEFVDPASYPFAGTIEALVRAGALRATSVGFRPIKWMFNEDRRGVDFTEQELLEYSIVPVPANPHCLIEARAAGVDVEPLREWAEKTLAHLRDPAELARGRSPAVAAVAASLVGEFQRLLGNRKFFVLDAPPEETEPVYERPYPNEHACRLRDPGDYDAFRRGTRKHDGKEYAVIYGRKGDAWEDQAYRYPKGTWSADEARTHCAAHDGRFDAARERDGETRDDHDPDADRMRAEMDQCLDEMGRCVQAATAARDRMGRMRDELGKAETGEDPAPEEPELLDVETEDDDELELSADDVVATLRAAVGAEVERALARAAGRID